jgi:hypothetical protein
MIKLKPSPKKATDLYDENVYMKSPNRQSSILSTGQNTTNLELCSSEKKFNVKFGDDSLPSGIWERQAGEPTKPKQCYRMQTLGKIKKMKIEDNKKLMKFTKDLKLPNIYVQKSMLDP